VTGAVPQPTDGPHCGSYHLVEMRRKDSAAAIIAAKKTFWSRTFSTPTRGYTHRNCKEGVGVEPLFMLRCDRSPVMLTWFHQLSLPACYKPVFTRGGLLLVCASSAPNRRQKLRNKPQAVLAHLVSDFSYHNLVTTVGPFTPTGHCLEIA